VPTENTRSVVQGLLLAWFLLFPSLGVVQKYIGSKLALAYAAAGTVALLAVAVRASALRARLERLGGRGAWAAIVALVAGFAVSLAVLHPMATSGEASWLSPSGIAGGGSDRDDALTAGVQALLSGRYPYYEHTQIGNAPSQLPGSLLLAAPFVMAGSVVWQNLLWFGAWLAALHYVMGDPRAVLATAGLTVAASPVVMQDFVTGGDLGTNGIVVLVACLVLVWTTAGRTGGDVGMGRLLAVPEAAASMFAGVAFASRSHFLLILPLLFQLLRRRAGSRTALACLSVLLMTSAAITLPFFLYDPQGFAPLGVQNKFAQLFSTVLPGAGLLFPAASVAVALLAAAKARSADWPAWLIACGVVLTVPAALLAGVAVLVGSTSLILTSYALPGVFFGVTGCTAKLLGYRPGPADRAPAPR
jgi:hypothetical protein